MYFCVKTPVRIANKHYSPCIGYKVTEEIKATVARLVASGKAYSQEDPIYFQSGARLEQVKPAVKATANKGKKRLTRAVKEAVTVEEPKAETDGAANEGF